MPKSESKAKNADQNAGFQEPALKFTSAKKEYRLPLSDIQTGQNQSDAASYDGRYAIRKTFSQQF